MSTYTPIASITLASATAEITFTGIPQTYTDLVLVVAGAYDSGGVGSVDIRVGNGSIDTGSNYSATQLDGSGSSAASYRDTNATNLNLGVASTSQSTNIFHFMNYANTTTNKTILSRGNEPTYVRAAVGLWRSTSAINQIRIRNSGGTNFASNTTFNLYGVANASITNVAKATGGDSVYTDGTYWYHIFRSSGTFTPTQALTADYLVVAGGGGGGRNNGGGGGAGGMRCTVTATGGGGSLESALSLTAQAYTVTVGAGGTGQTSTTPAAASGSNSVFSTVTSTGGGGGGGYDGSAYQGGYTGGSGGGSAGSDGLAGGARTSSPVQGNNGGGCTSGNEAGGGGGAGAAGAAGVTGTPGSGGNGAATSISGSSVTYAGGGGGGQRAVAGSTAVMNNGGTGGGGGGSQSNNSTVVTGGAGTANTGGGGGGGSRNDANGGAGGSGIVIVRYGI